MKRALIVHSAELLLKIVIVLTQVACLSANDYDASLLPPQTQIFIIRSLSSLYEVTSQMHATCNEGSKLLGCRADVPGSHWRQHCVAASASSNRQRSGFHAIILPRTKTGSLEHESRKRCPSRS